MNGNRASGLRKGYAGPSLHDGNSADQQSTEPKGDFRQASHTNEEKTSNNKLAIIIYLIFHMFICRQWVVKMVQLLKEWK